MPVVEDDMTHRIALRLPTLALLFGATALPYGAGAEILQQVVVSYQPPAGLATEDGDVVRVPPDAALRTVSAAIAGSGFGAAGSIGTFGNLGVRAETFVNGTLLTQHNVFSDEFVNPFSAPLHAQANFIIDGGSLSMLADVGSTLSFQLALQATIRDGTGAFDRSAAFVADIELEQTAAGLQFQTFGPSLGATLDGPFGVDIPLSLQTLDLGLIAAGGTIDLDYLLTIQAETVGFTEIAAWRFSDPFDVDGTGEFPTVVFSDPAAVPEPAGLASLVLGALGLRFTRRRT
jgi:hypothetical protein